MLKLQVEMLQSTTEQLEQVPNHEADDSLLPLELVSKPVLLLCFIESSLNSNH